MRFGIWDQPRAQRTLPTLLAVSTPVVAPPPTPPSPQPGEGKKSRAEVWAGPVLGFIGGIIVALIGLAGVILVTDGDTSPGPPKITITNKDKISPTFTNEVTIEGKVENLGPGQTVWCSTRRSQT